MFGQEIHAHHRSVGEVGDLIKPRNWRHGGAASDIDENFLGGEFFAVDGDPLGPGETSTAPENGAALHAA
jgi:hypothetical protein